MLKIYASLTVIFKKKLTFCHIRCDSMNSIDVLLFDI